MIANKKIMLKKVRSEVLYHDNEIVITLEINGEYTFQIGKNYTSDVLEGVAILMRNPRWNNSTLWNLEVEIEAINSINCLYWLSGGDEFWEHPECKMEWVDAYPLILKKFEKKINNVTNKKSLNDIRKYFRKHFNLDVFYEFALSKGIIK